MPTQFLERRAGPCSGRVGCNYRWYRSPGGAAAGAGLPGFAVITVPDASFSGNYEIDTGGGSSITTWKQDLNSAGTIGKYFAQTWTDPDGVDHYMTASASASISSGPAPHCSCTGWASESPPLSPNTVCRATASALLYYHFIAVPKTSDAPPTMVPIIISAAGAYSIPNPKYGFVMVEIGFAFSGGPATWILQSYTDALSGPTQWHDSTSYHASIPTSTDWIVYVDTLGQIYGKYSTPDTWTAAANSIVQIDPKWTVTVKGQSVPGTELYGLRFSSRFGPWPLPGVHLLLLD